MDQETRAFDAYRVLNVRPDAHQVVVRAAFHALAGLYHPDLDHSPEAGTRMVQLNRAYEQVRTPDGRAAHDKLAVIPVSPPVVVPVSPPAAPASPSAWQAPGAQAPPVRHGGAERAGDAKSATLDFGRYNGWTLAELAKHDPDYLRWLKRHTSGLRYRREIGERLAASAGAAVASPSAPARGRWSILGL